MNDSSTDTDPMVARITQLENERDELRKDIEQLCTQQAGPSYLHIAARMHFQRTAGLEQEIAKLQKELAECTRDRLNIKEELSEAHRIKIQLEQLHRVEVAKKLEFERQLKFFQGNIASAFADRDNAFMEAEKAKEKEELMSRKLNDCKKRLEELTADASKAQDLITRLQTDAGKHEEENAILKKIVDKFYHIKQQSSFDCDYEFDSYLDKCSNLLDDPEEVWSFNANREAENEESISALEQERDSWKESAVKFQNKIRMGLDIEAHLKRKVRELEKKKRLSDKYIKDEISRLHQYHYEQRAFIVNLLNEGKSFLISIVTAIEQKFGPIMLSGQENSSLPDLHSVEDVHMKIQTVMNISTRNPTAVEVADNSNVLSQALQEKVSALMLLEQQEERHFLERNENTGLLQRLGELQRSLNQVTAEKLEALMKLEHLERMFLRECHRKTNHENQPGNVSTNERDGTLATVVKEGRFKNLLKRTGLKRFGAADFDAPESGFQPSTEGYFPFRKSSNNMDVARLKIENATLNESMRNLEQLTSQIYKLRQALVKAHESFMWENGADDDSALIRNIDIIINEANLVHTALSISLPLSWSAVGDDASSSDAISDKFCYEDSKVVKIESVSAAGIEMVQLLLLAAEIVKDRAELLKQDH